MILLPIFPQNAFEKELLVHEIAGAPFIALQLRAAKTDNTMVFTDNDLVGGFAARLNLPWRKISLRSRPHCAPFLPPGSRESLAALQQDGRCRRDASLLIADYRFFPLRPEILAAAIIRYHDTTESALLSISPVDDNPCQLHQHFLAKAIDLLFTDSDCSSVSGLCRRLGGDSQGDEEEGINLFSLSRCGLPFYDIDPGICPTTEGENAPNLPAEGDLPVAHFFDTNTDKPEMASLPNRFSPAPLPEKQVSLKTGKFMMVREGNLSHLYIRKTDLPDNATLRVFPINQEQKKPKNIPYRAPKLRILQKKYLGPICSFASRKKPEAVIVATLAPTQGETSELFRHMHTSEELWKYDPEQRATLNLLSGEKITGRQSCVEIYQPDGAFMISSLKQFTRLDELLHRGKTAGFVWPDDKHVNMRSKLDLLRLKVLLKSNSPEPARYPGERVCYLPGGQLDSQLAKPKQHVSLV